MPTHHAPIIKKPDSLRTNSLNCQRKTSPFRSKMGWILIIIKKKKSTRVHGRLSTDTVAAPGISGRYRTSARPPTHRLFAPVKTRRTSPTHMTVCRRSAKAKRDKAYGMQSGEEKTRERSCCICLHEKAGADDEHRDGVRLVQPRRPRVVLVHLGGGVRRPPILGVPRPRLLLFRLHGAGCHTPADYRAPTAAAGA
jgi:hypothetical protein